MAATYITSSQLKATLTIGTTYADADVSAAIAAASRAIDNLCNRRFYADTDANQVRYYTPTAASLLQIDDLIVLTSLKTDPAGDNTFGDTWTLHTDFELEPLNAAADGWPWTRVRIRGNGSFIFPALTERSVQITGQFGWATVPDAIVQATTIIASKLLKRSREAPFGILAIGVNGEAIRLARLDPDVNTLVGPYMKHRVTVG